MMTMQYESQKLGLKYFAAAITLFGVMVVAGLLAATSYVFPGFLPWLPFSIQKILHIDTLVIWLLMGFLGSIYYLLPLEYKRDLVGMKLANVVFWLFCATVAVVAVVFIVVQTGPGDEKTLWLINQGRKYVEAPRWAAAIITVGVLVFIYNVAGTAFAAGKRMTGVLWVLILDLVPLGGLYLIAFPAITNMATDQFWWWWLVHFWVEATWEVLMACIVAILLMNLTNTRRSVVESWLYIEVALVLGTGVLGIGHHYFWIGAPKYWMGIGGIFSALEPLPLLGMVVHGIYDAGEHSMRAANRPALYWMLAEAFGNFVGAGVWGFMITLPQVNMFAHGTQWTVSHGHFAFWGAYGCGVLSIIYFALQHQRNAAAFSGRAWKWGFALLNLGMIGMVGGLLVSGVTQAFYERAIGGSTFNAFMTAQQNPWFVEGMYFRLGAGLVFAAGYFVLVYDLLTIGKRASVPANISPRAVSASAGD